MFSVDVWIYCAASPVKASGRCLVSRRRQGDLPSHKYHAPKLQTLAKMQSLSLKHWQNAVSHGLKMLRFWFSFTKATKSSGVLFAFSQSVTKMCKDLILGARWQRWCLIRDGLGLGVLVLCKGVKETTWILSRPREEALQKKGQLSPQIVLPVYKTHLWTQRRQEGPRTSEEISDVKRLLKGHLWGQICMHSYSLAQACIQNHSSAPNTCGIALETTAASPKLCRDRKRVQINFKPTDSQTKITFAN